VPIGPSSRVDIVPVSFVVDAMVGLLERETLRYDCYHISAGHDQALRCSDAAAYLDYFYGRINPLHLVPPTEWTRQMHRQYVGTAHQRKLFATLKYYLPFVNMNVAYDNGRLREELGDAAVKVPPMTDYLGDLLRLVTPELQANGTLERTSVNAAATPM
jgi:hypothetical protein